MGALEAEQTVTDDKGRVLVVREIGALEEMDLLEAAGEAASSNRRWMVNATLYACVRSIDGVPRPFPTTRQMIRQHIEMVGGAGLAAVVRALAPDVPERSGASSPERSGASSEEAGEATPPAAADAQAAQREAGEAMGRVAGN